MVNDKNRLLEEILNGNFDKPTKNIFPIYSIGDFSSTISLMKPLDKKVIDGIRVVRKIGDEIHVLSEVPEINRTGFLRTYSMTSYYHVRINTKNRETSSEVFKVENRDFYYDSDCPIIFPGFYAKIFTLLLRRKQTNKQELADFQAKTEEYRHYNLEELDQKIDSIKLFKENKREFEEKLGLSVTFVSDDVHIVYGDSIQDLKIKAYLLGADYLIQYRKSEKYGVLHGWYLHPLHIATPVKTAK